MSLQNLHPWPLSLLRMRNMLPLRLSVPQLLLSMHLLLSRNLSSKLTNHRNLILSWCSRPFLLTPDTSRTTVFIVNTHRTTQSLLKGTLKRVLKNPFAIPTATVLRFQKPNYKLLSMSTRTKQSTAASHPSSSKLRILGKSLDNHYLQSISTNLLNLNCSTDVNQGDIANELVPTKHRVVPRQRTRASQPLFGTHVV